MKAFIRFSENIGLFDRVIRLIVAFLLFAFAYVKTSWIVLAAAVFVLFESCVGWCILYQILGKSSCPVPKHKKK